MHKYADAVPFWADTLTVHDTDRPGVSPEQGNAKLHFLLLRM